ncbi:hypothetical protein GQ55_6G058900 [Panicum hallii var. hallii]|uniref:Uncharacterized protein n=2 Tax=Panicum hallii TaxID=206008 RepID=A0A2T7D4B3_9POAL|nr:hypothetical protein PAHAL_6G061100 [Panicum hallii]PUZ50434.1 hypothetical protein GQ55_6G058900 [Panicum hallii var. hallii]
MVQLIGRITMEVAPSKMPSIIRRARLPKILDTIMEDDKEALESPRAPSHNGSRIKEAVDTPMYCSDKLAFLVPMAKTECLKIKA